MLPRTDTKVTENVQTADTARLHSRGSGGRSPVSYRRDRFDLPSSPCGICGGHNCNGSVFLSQHFGFPLSASRHLCSIPNHSSYHRGCVILTDASVVKMVIILVTQVRNLHDYPGNISEHVGAARCVGHCDWVLADRIKSSFSFGIL